MYSRTRFLAAMFILWMPFWAQAASPVIPSQGDDDASVAAETGTEIDDDDDDALIEGEDPLADIRKLRFYNKKSVAKKAGILGIGAAITGGLIGGVGAIAFLALDAALVGVCTLAVPATGGKGGNAFLNKAQYKKLFKMVEASYIHQGLLKARSEQKEKHARSRIHDFYVKYIVGQYPATRLNEDDVAKQFVKAHKAGLFSHEVKQKIKHGKALSIVPEAFTIARIRGYSESDLMLNPEPSAYKKIKRVGWMKMTLSKILFYQGSLTPVDILQEQYEIMSQKAKNIAKKKSQGEESQPKA